MHRLQDLDKQQMFTNPIQFYDFFLNRVVVTFRPKFEDATADNEFSVTLSKKNTYEQVRSIPFTEAFLIALAKPHCSRSQMAQKVGERLKHDYLKIRFTQSNGANGNPKTIIRRQANHTVAELIQPGYMATSTNLLYYELLEVSIIELETKKSLKITWVSPTNKEEGSHPFLLPKNTNMNDVAQEFLRKEVKLQPAGTGQIRIFELVNGRTQKFFQGNEVVRDISESTELYAEEVPVEEEEHGDDERLVQVYHFNKDPSRAHGVPFKFVLRPVRYHLSLTVLI